MNKIKYLDYIFVSIIFTLTAIFFFNFDRGLLLENNYFPWDSYYYYEMAINFRDNLDLSTFKSPYNERVLFPFVVSLLSSHLSLNISYACLVLNLISTLLTTYIIIFFLNEFKISYLSKFFVTFIFLTSFIMPLRFSVYYPGSNFAFDVLMVSLISSILYFEIKKSNNFFFIISIPLSIIGTLERGILILMIYLLPLIILILFNKLTQKKNIIIKNQIKKFFIYTFVSFTTLVLIKIYGFEPGEGYSMITEIISSIQFQANIFEFFYKYYYSFGVIFLLIFTFVILNIKKLIYRVSKIKNLKIENLFITSLFLNSIIFSTIGGRGDVDRFLLWFLLPYIVISAYILDQFYLIKKFKKVFPIIFFLGLLGARVFVPAIPPLAFSDIFIDKNHVNTNFRDDLFFGPKFLKKFKNEMSLHRIGKDEVYKNVYDKYHQNLSQEVEIPAGQYFHYGQYRNYIHAYKYRINDIPFPIGYIHNQRNALVDHPYHGHRIIRFSYILQWLFIQLLLVFYLKKFEFRRIFK